jgi:hypothetical protein
MPGENMLEPGAIDPWIALGVFLLGAGAGSLASAVLHAEQIRNLKKLLEAVPRNSSQTERQVQKSDERKSA